MFKRLVNNKNNLFYYNKIYNRNYWVPHIKEPIKPIKQIKICNCQDTNSECKNLKLIELNQSNNDDNLINLIKTHTIEIENIIKNDLKTIKLNLTNIVVINLFVLLVVACVK